MTVGVSQFSVIISSVKDTFNALYSLLNYEIRYAKEDPKIIVFGTTNDMVALFARLFEGQTNLKLYELHKGLDQSQQMRTIEAFKHAESGIMFATDGIPLRLFHSVCLLTDQRFSDHQAWRRISKRYHCYASWASRKFGYIHSARW